MPASVARPEASLIELAAAVEPGREPLDHLGGALLVHPFLQCRNHRSLDLVVADAVLIGQCLERPCVTQLTDEVRALDAERIGGRLQDVAREEPACHAGSMPAAEA